MACIHVHIHVHVVRVWVRGEGEVGREGENLLHSEVEKWFDMLHAQITHIMLARVA